MTDKSIPDGLKCDLCTGRTFKHRYEFEDIYVLECRSCGLAFVQAKTDTSGLDVKKIYTSDYFLEREEYFDQSQSETLKGLI